MRRHRLILPPLILMIGLVSSTSQAATIHVPADYSDIQEAVFAAEVGDTVQLAAGSYTTYHHGGSEALNHKPGVLLRGNPDDPASVEIHAQNMYAILCWLQGDEHPYLIEGIMLNNGSGGDLYISGPSQVEVRDCIFRVGNSIYSDAGGVSIMGNDTEALFTRCHFQDIELHFDGNGGAVWVAGGAVAEFRECSFSGNQAGDTGFGGAIAFTDAGAGLIINCTFADNSAGSGGGISIEACHVDIDNSIFAQNSGAGIMLAGGGSVALSCCDIFGNEGGDWHAQIVEQLGVNGNFSANPEFCGVLGSGNYYLQSDSPCAPANNDCGLLIGAFPVGCLETVTETRSWGALKALY